MTLSDDIKARLSIVEEFQRDGHSLKKIGSRLVCLCPFHQERTPSCNVNPAIGRFHCFGCGKDGTVIDYHALKRGIAPADAITELTSRLRIGPGSAHESNRNHSALPKLSDKPDRPRALPKLPLLRKGSPSEIEQLAKLRCLSVEALRLASNRGLLRFCRLNDGPERVAAWVITDRTRRTAQARRLDGTRWQHAWDADLREWLPVEPARRRKVRGFTGSQSSWPAGLEEAQPFEGIALVEGVDLLAAFHFLIAENRDDAVAPVAMFGASNRIPKDALSLFAGKRVRMFPHLDDAGLRAALRWEAQLGTAVAHIDAFDLTGLTTACGNAVKDLNDLTGVDPDCFESEPELRSMMNF